MAYEASGPTLSSVWPPSGGLFPGRDSHLAPPAKGQGGGAIYTWWRGCRTGGFAMTQSSRRLLISSDDRLAEISEILAAGFLRLHARLAEQSNFLRRNASQLDFDSLRSV